VVSLRDQLEEPAIELLVYLEIAGTARLVRGSGRHDGDYYSSLASAPASHVDARDIAAVIAATLTDPLDRHGGGIHLLTGPAAFSFDHVAERRSRGSWSARFDTGTSGMTTSRPGCGRPVKRSDRPAAVVELNANARQGHATVVTDPIERTTGRAAGTLEPWLRDHAAAFRPWPADAG
jgi:hypothetical protein